MHVISCVQIPTSDLDSVLSRPDVAGAISDADKFCFCESDSTCTYEDWFDALQIGHELAP